MKQQKRICTGTEHHHKDNKGKSCYFGIASNTLTNGLNQILLKKRIQGTKKACEPLLQIEICDL